MCIINVIISQPVAGENGSIRPGAFQRNAYPLGRQQLVFIFIRRSYNDDPS